MRSIVVLLSGRGSNLESIARSCASGALEKRLKITAVIADRDACAGTECAKSLGIASYVVPFNQFEQRTDFEQALADLIRPMSVDWIVLAGFMRVLGADFVAEFAGRLINIHPSLLPLFPGLHTHRQALQAKATEHGATVHYVTAQLDAGPTILQAKVPVLQNDDELSLAKRVLVAEHDLYPAALLKLIEQPVARTKNDEFPSNKK